MDLNQLTELNEKRRAIRPLLSPTDPADALTSYYALWHDPRRTQLTLHHDDQRRVDGFVAVSQTGVDLFRLLVTLHAPDNTATGELLQTALAPARPYRFIIPVALAGAVRDYVEVGRSSLNRIYLLDTARFRPVINVLVQRVGAADGAPRFEIESQGEIMAMSGTNWRSPTFAEVFVYTHPRGRGRGWGRSVVSACTTALLEEKLRPLYIVDEGNQASIRTAEAVGYVDTGLREFAGEGQLK
ncbi:MAG: GNAT family N-acetyltransferase [Anaerolineae bacterium]|nr:GNAT family N-acetyltransferase [Anaerolineae bacterium]